MLSLSLLALTFNSAHAYSTGITGRSTTGCGCHGSASTSTTSTFSVDASTIAPGETLTVEFLVSSTDSSRTAAGLNVSASDGTLAAGSNTRVSSSQITHSSATSMTSGTTTFDFTWTAPSTEGTYTLYGAGNAVNVSGSNSGDGWDLADNLTITVDDGCNDFDSDGYQDCDDDCDDEDASVSPGATETCDGVDNDCDGEADEDDAADASVWYWDEDGDGYGVEEDTVASCSMPAGYAALSGDCDDGDSAFNPGASESDCADPNDYNCDGSVGFSDSDGDGYAACEDCDDLDSASNPDGAEVCDAADNDCDGEADEDASDALTWYADTDGDGYGDAGATTTACDEPDGYSADATDCDDSSDGVNPGETETWYDGVDQDCDSNDDDQDGDGAALDADCDDEDASIQTGCDTGGGETGGEETGGETGAPDTGDTGAAADDSGKDTAGGGCSCASAPAPAGALALFLGMLALVRRRRA